MIVILEESCNQHSKTTNSTAAHVFPELEHLVLLVLHRLFPLLEGLLQRREFVLLHCEALGALSQHLLHSTACIDSDLAGLRIPRTERL